MILGKLSVSGKIFNPRTFQKTDKHDFRTCYANKLIYAFYLLQLVFMGVCNHILVAEYQR